MDTSTPALKVLADISNHFNISKNNTPCPLNGPKNNGCKKLSPSMLGGLKPPDLSRKRSSLALIMLAQVNSESILSPLLDSTQQAKRKRSPFSTPQVTSDDALLSSLENTQQSTFPKVRASQKISRGVARTQTQKKTSKPSKPRRTLISRKSRQGAVFTVDKIHEDPITHSDMQRLPRGSVDLLIDHEYDESTPSQGKKKQKMTGVHWKAAAEAEMRTRDDKREDAVAELMGWKKISMGTTTKAKSKARPSKQTKTTLAAQAQQQQEVELQPEAEKHRRVAG